MIFIGIFKHNFQKLYMYIYTIILTCYKLYGYDNRPVADLMKPG